MVSAAIENGLPMNVLPQIAQVFSTEWTRLRAQPTAKPQARLSADLLTVEIRNALTARERSLAQTEIGHNVVVRLVDQWIDSVYPRLAGQVESLLDCYITSTGVELEPEDGCVRLQIGLRRSPALLM